MKNIIKKLLPDVIIYKIKLFKLYLKSKKSDAKIRNYISKTYYNSFNNKLDWDNPKKYSEKMNISKYLCSNELKTKLTDKYEVRNWIKEKIGEEYLVPIFGIYDKFDDIDFNKLPKKFVIKCTHDSASVTIVEDKEKLDYKDLKNKYNFFLKRNLAYEQYEMHYKNIKPRIIIEKYMGKSIIDYKFLCFNGKPYFCWIDLNRFSNHNRNIYDMNWNIQPFNINIYKNSKNSIQKPKNFDKMKKIAEKLSKEFDHVRVDLYDIDGKIYFGEMTFTSASGLAIIDPEEYDYKLGELWDLKY